MEAAIRRAMQPDNQHHLLPFVPVEDAKDDVQPIISSPSFGEDEESPFRETPEEQPRKPFIEANTKQVSLYHLKNDCITPVFSKDNEVTISHNQFIETMWECAQRMFRGDTVDNPEIRVSHIVKGGTPEAIHKAVHELTDADKTIYYERMMFCIEIPSVTETIDGCRLNLTIGGVRAYNQENLYSKKGFEKFKVFIGFKNMVCCNMCVATDGVAEEIRVTNTQELTAKITELVVSYNAKRHLERMRALIDCTMSESQFAQLVGKARLYQFLPPPQRKLLPEFEFTDCHLNTIARAYYNDPAFACDKQGEIDLWRVFNLFTGANKSSYIDSFLTRSRNAAVFADGLAKALAGEKEYSWFVE